jgi:hypothetical protein
VTPALCRRAFCALAAAATASPALAAPAPLEGTWGGGKGALSAQVIIVGAALIGFFWRDAYQETQGPQFAPDGRSLSFVFAGGMASLTLAGARATVLEVREGDKRARLVLRRD